MAWESVLGKDAEHLLADNTDKWSGDHAMAADLVPGVLLSNRKLGARQPGLADLAPSILQELGTPRPVGMEGRWIF